MILGLFLIALGCYLAYIAISGKLPAYLAGRKADGASK